MNPQQDVCLKLLDTIRLGSNKFNKSGQYFYFLGV